MLRKGNETKGPERPWSRKAQTSEGKEKPRTEKYNKKKIKRRTNMTINEFLLKTFVPEDPKLKKIYDDIRIPKEDRVLSIRPRVKCADGFTFSAQAGSALYCTPRITLYPETWGDGYQEIELGYPSAYDELIEEYAETDDDYTKTVYAYVPVEVVDQLVAKHGGIAGEDRSNIKEKE